MNLAGATTSASAGFAIQRAIKLNDLRQSPRNHRRPLSANFAREANDASVVHLGFAQARTHSTNQEFSPLRNGNGIEIARDKFRIDRASKDLLNDSEERAQWIDLFQIINT